MRGIRLAMTFLQMVHFKSWQSQPLRDVFLPRSQEFWRHIVVDAPITADQFTESDYWAALALVRDGADVDDSVLNCLTSAEDLFVGGWPLFVSGAQVGCLAHYFLTEIGSDIPPRLQESRAMKHLQDLIVSNATLVRGGLNPTNYPDFEAGDRTRFEDLARAELSVDQYEVEDWVSLLFLLVGIASLNDMTFVDTVLTRLLPNDWSPAIHRDIDYCRYPALLDLKLEHKDQSVIPPTTRERISSALAVIVRSDE
jgi:hypothetical protein